MSSTAEPPLVVLPVYGRLDLVERAVRAIDATTATDVPLLVVDDAGPQALEVESLASWLGSSRPWELVTHPVNLGFVGTANDGFARRTGRDVVLVNSDVVVFEGWLDGLRSALTTRPRVASVTASTNNGSLATVAGGSTYASPQALAPVASAARADDEEPRRVPVCVGHCVLIADAALSDVGAFDPAFAPGYGEEVDWSFRAARAGWHHVVAPSVVVWHDGGQSFDRVPVRKRWHELKILRRHPKEFLRLRGLFPGRG